MRQALYVDCCVRGEQSRTRQLAEAFLAALPKDYEVTHLNLMEEKLNPLTCEPLRERDELLRSGRTDSPRFGRARQIAAADLVIFAAPFWDLSFPALLKIYIENVSVEGLTFHSTEKGLLGLCKAEHCVYLVTRGGLYSPDGQMEQGTQYLQAIQKFFGFGDFHCVSADGLDIDGMDADAILKDACARAAELAGKL